MQKSMSVGEFLNMMEKERKKSKGEYFSDYDQETGYWCVFHTDIKTGHAYYSFFSEEEAERKVKELNS